MTNLEVYECEDESKIVFNRLIDTWRWGTIWEKCVKEGEDYFYIVYRRASGDMPLDLEDTLNYKQDKQAQKVVLIEFSMLKAVSLDNVTLS
jgi:hypothetical protein